MWNCYFFLTAVNKSFANDRFAAQKLGNANRPLIFKDPMLFKPTLCCRGVLGRRLWIFFTLDFVRAKHRDWELEINIT